MNTTATTAITAKSLLADLATYSPFVDGNDLAFVMDPGDELITLAVILQSGIRAVLAHKLWFGCDETGLAFVLRPELPIPAGVALLCCEGDSSWDRIAYGARAKHPEMFSKGVTGGR
jgi:hypothetical protein